MTKQLLLASTILTTLAFSSSVPLPALAQGAAADGALILAQAQPEPKEQRKPEEGKPQRKPTPPPGAKPAAPAERPAPGAKPAAPERPAPQAKPPAPPAARQPAPPPAAKPATPPPPPAAKPAAPPERPAVKQPPAAPPPAKPATPPTAAPAARPATPPAPGAAPSRQNERQEQKQEQRQDQRQDQRQERRDQRQDQRPDQRQNQRQEQKQDQRQEQRQDQRQERRDERQRPGAPAATTPGTPPAAPGARPAVPPANAPAGTPPAARVAPGAPGATPPSAAAQPKNIEGLRRERTETKQGDRTIIRESDRTIIKQGDRTIIRHNEAERFRTVAPNARFERRGDDTVTVIQRPGGVQVYSETGPDGRLLRRYRRDSSGREVVIIDNRSRGPRADENFYVRLPPPVIRIPRERYIVDADQANEGLIYDTLIAPPVEALPRRYSLDEIRYSNEVRDRMPRIDIDTINFETGSWEVTPDQANRLAPIAEAINRAVQKNPAEVFLIEGHTDAVGSDDDNLSLSDRRAESVAVLLSEQFQVPPENLTTQGYGEQYLKVSSQGPERQNRRVTVRRITPLLAGNEQNGGGAPPPPAPR